MEVIAKIVTVMVVTAIKVIAMIVNAVKVTAVIVSAMKATLMKVTVMIPKPSNIQKVQSRCLAVERLKKIQPLT